MNKNIVLAIGGLVIVLVAGGFYISGIRAKDAAMVQEKMSQEAAMEKDKAVDTAAMVKEDDTMKKGSYETYGPEKIATAASRGNVVLFFRASWCPTCKAVDADIKANLGSIPENLTILDVDYDNSSALKVKYGVTQQHTFVEVDKDGGLIKKWLGSPTLAALVARVK